MDLFPELLKELESAYWVIYFSVALQAPLGDGNHVAGMRRVIA